MIINSIKITNFGLYKGENFVELSPDSLLNRNITVISGQNGVGKSTLQEAIHLCLLGSLSIDNRVSEASYERYLSKRSYRGQTDQNLKTSIELNFGFIKSGNTVNYQVCRFWHNNAADLGEDISIAENGKILLELSKKEKNLFLRELIQPGLARVMFFDGEKLLSLYDQGNLSSFIGESCRYLFGLNFVDLLSTDLNYYINKLQTQQDSTQVITEINKVKEELKEIQNQTVSLEAHKTSLLNELNELKQKAVQAERIISDQGRWAAGTFAQLKSERERLEKEIIVFKRELVEIYSSIGPFVFCKTLCTSLKDRLMIERDMEKWQHAADLFDHKLLELENNLNNPVYLKALGIDLETSRKLFPVLKDSLLTKPLNANGKDRVYHELSDTDRNKIIGWIDEVINTVSSAILFKSEAIAQRENRLKSLNKEQNSFSKDDQIAHLLKDLQEFNKNIGANEQKLDTLNRKTDETNKRKDAYASRLIILEDKLQKEDGVDERLKLSSRTKLVLERYAKKLMSQKLLLLTDKILEKFNLLCRKESYLDDLIIDDQSFEIMLSRGQVIVEHGHLSAGEKQLLVVSILWGLRELTNISLPLIIDTPLARLDLEHRRTFIEKFLPAIQPQVILIGTDMELAGDVINGLDRHIAHQYSLTYSAEEHATQLNTVERSYLEKTHHEI